MAFRVHLDGRELEVEILARRPALRLRIAGREYRVGDAHAAHAEFALEVDGQRHCGWWCRQGEEVHVQLGGRSYQVRFNTRGTSASGAPRADEIRASMPGVVVTLHRAAGEVVAAGDALLTIESMKLQATLTASHAARIVAVHVAPQAVFERGALLMSLAPEESA
jgi:acetyl/propionyl-CoA carboxylase alpha subunit